MERNEIASQDSLLFAKSEFGPASDPTVSTFAQRPDLLSKVFGPEIESAMPEFMRHDPTDGLYYRDEALEFFREFGLVAVDPAEPERPVARAFSVPFAFRDGTEGREELPGGGWDRVIRWADTDRLAGRHRTAVSALEIMVAPRLQRRGISRLMLAAMRDGMIDPSGNRWRSVRQFTLRKKFFSDCGTGERDCPAGVFRGRHGRTHVQRPRDDQDSGGWPDRGLHTMENSPLRTGEPYASINATGPQDAESRSPRRGLAGPDRSLWLRRRGEQWNLPLGRRACCRCCGSWRHCFSSSTGRRNFLIFRRQQPQARA